MGNEDAGQDARHADAWQDAGSDAFERDGRLIGEKGRAALYDAACKRLLSQRVILAQIMRGLLGEYEGCSVDEIARSCIEGAPHVDGSFRVGEGAPPLVAGVDVRGASLTAGQVDFDVLVYAKRPSGVCNGRMREDASGLTGLVINVEAQHDFSPGYPLLKRAQYYCAQLLVAQYGTEFTNSHYERLRKVYSIWLCTNPPKRLRGTVGWYETGERTFPEGTSGWNRSAYDLFGIVMVYLNDHDTGRRDGHHGLVNLLSMLFVSRLSASEKLEFLAKEYNIAVSHELEGGVRAMGSFAQGLMERSFSDGKVEGKAEGIVQSLESLVRSTGWTIDRAMDVLGISRDERPDYRERLTRRLQS